MIICFYRNKIIYNENNLITSLKKKSSSVSREGGIVFSPQQTSNYSF